MEPRRRPARESSGVLRAFGPSETTLAWALVALLMAAGVAMISGTARASSGPGLVADSVNNGLSPPPTQRASITYDTAAGYVLMFGGMDANLSTVATTWA